MSFTVPPTVRTRGSAAYCERFPTRPANRAPHFFALAFCAALGACGERQPYPAPDASACDDYRTVTFFQFNGEEWGWYCPFVKKLCIVREHKI